MFDYNSALPSGSALFFYEKDHNFSPEWGNSNNKRA